MQQVYEEGGVVAGTSAGASVLCETMLVSGEGDASPHVGETVRMAPGLGFVRGILIDQHRDVGLGHGRTSRHGLEQL